MEYEEKKDAHPDHDHPGRAAGERRPRLVLGAIIVIWLIYEFIT
jgi:hypothetical protein